MRLMLIAMMAFIAGVLVSGASSHAAPGPGLATAWTVTGGMIQKVQLFPRRYYRQYGYPPGAVVVPAVPAVPVVPAPVPGAPIVEGAPAVVMVPARPASCGEYRYWNGVACVDARYNNPYLGPR